MIDSTSLVPGTHLQRLAMTPEEARVLHYLPTDLTFPAIAREWGLARSAVKAETASIYRRLGVSCRHDAVTEARHSGLLDAPLRTSDVPRVTRSKSRRTAERCQQLFFGAVPLAR
jgi:DNA-binding CsgD family transcriptional regulator